MRTRCHYYQGCIIIAYAALCEHTRTCEVETRDGLEFWFVLMVAQDICLIVMTSASFGETWVILILPCILHSDEFLDLLGRWQRCRLGILYRCAAICASAARSSCHRCWCPIPCRWCRDGKWRKLRRPHGKDAGF